VSSKELSLQYTPHICRSLHVDQSDAERSMRGFPPPGGKGELPRGHDPGSRAARFATFPTLMELCGGESVTLYVSNSGEVRT
jgi:hypothetical protein